MMGAITPVPTLTTTPSFTQTGNVNCLADYTLEFIDGTGAYVAAVVNTFPPFVRAIDTSTGGFDIYLDGVDALSISYRPEVFFDGRITVTLQDSILPTAQISYTDTFQIRVWDECMEDSLYFDLNGTPNLGYLIDSGPLTGF